MDYELDFDLGEEIDGVFAATIELCVAFLAAMAAGFENGHAFNACFEQCVFDSVEFGRLENGFDLKHTENASFDSVSGGGASWPDPAVSILSTTGSGDSL
jgi:hypothetical protein